MMTGCGQSVAGWQQVGGSELVGARCLAADPFVHAIVYACGSRGQVYRWRADKGNANEGGEGLPDSAMVVALTPDPRSAGVLYAGTSAGFYTSEDHGNTWQARSHGLPPGDSIDAIAAVPGQTSGQTAVFAGTPDHGVYVTADAGRPWSPANGGLPAGANVDALLWEPASQTLFVSLDQGGVFALPEGAATWVRRGSGLPGPSLSLASVSSSGGTLLFSGTSEGIFSSDDEGGHWSAISGLPSGKIAALASDPSHPGWLVAADDATVYRTRDAGLTWAPVAPALPSGAVAVLSVETPTNTIVFAAADRIYRDPALLPPAAGPFETVLSLLAALAAIAAAVWAFVRIRRQVAALVPRTRQQVRGSPPAALPPAPSSTHGHSAGQPQSIDAPPGEEAPPANGHHRVPR